MKTLFLVLLSLCLLPVLGRADGTPLPWDASAQAPTSFVVPIGQDPAVMAEAVGLLNGWKDRDVHMYPMPLRVSTPALIQTYDPTALGLFGVKITDTHATGVALIAVEASGYEGKIFEVSRQRHDANKRAHLLAYLLEEYAGVPTSQPSPAPMPGTSPAPAPPSASVVPFTPAADYGPTLRRLQTQLDAGQDAAALATIDALRAAVVAHQAAASPAGK